VRVHVARILSLRDVTDQVITPVATLRVECLRHPDSRCRIRKPESARHHAHDGALYTVEHEPHAEDRAVAAQLLPQSMAHDRNRFGAGRVVARLKAATHERRRAEHVEQLG
jgi:hypothetical protein